MLEKGSEMSHVAFRPDSHFSSTIRRRGTAVLVPLLLSLPVIAGFSPVYAQNVDIAIPGARQATPQQAAPQQRANRPLQNLKEGLEATDWNAERRGPLLALDTMQVRAWMPEREPGDWYSPYQPPQPLMATTEGRGLNVETVAPYFGRKVVRVGSLWVLAPTEMNLINTRLPKPDPLRGLRRNEKMMLFQALLNDAQWQKLCGEQGLGLGDLSGEQRDLFLALLPNPIRVVQFKPYPGGGSQMVYPGVPEGQYPSKPMDPRMTLTDAQRQGIRLRINRKTTMTIPNANSNNQYYGGGAYVDTQSTGEQTWYSLASGDEYGRKDSYGITIAEKVTSRLKQGNIDFESPSLNPSVSLAELKTVEDLMQRIREATRVEIYADVRVGKLALGGIGLEGSVRSGDALKALAWAVTGAYRKVGPVFILTDDVVGVGTRKAYVNAWEAIGSASKQKLMDKARRQIQAKSPMQYTRFASDDQMALSDDMMKRVESKWNTNMGRYQGQEMRLLDLPPAMQTNAKKAIDNHLNNDKNGRNPILTDRVRVNIQVTVSFIVPEMGTVRGDNFGWYDAMSTMLPPAEPDYGPGRKPPSTDPAVIPARMTAGGILYVAPQNKEETVLAAEIAKLRGMKQLWVLLPIDPAEGKELLTAAIKAGKAQGIPVYGVLRLMVAPPSRPIPKEPPVVENNSENAVNLNITPAPEDRDRNVLGETSSMALVRQMSMPERWPGYFAAYMTPGDWLRPDAPLTLPTLKQRVISIASTPGLAGIVLRDIVPTGYESKGDDNMYYGGGLGGDYGYSEEHRIALIRKESIDPVDITGQNYTEANVDLPFFREQYRNWVQQPDGSMRMDTNTKTPTAAWARLRYDIGMQMLTDLYRGVRKEIPIKVPILVSEVGMNFGGRWYGTWDVADKIPVRQQNNPVIFADGGFQNSTAKRPVDMAREFSKTVYTSIMMIRAIGDFPGMDQEKIKYGTPEYFARSINSILEEEAKQKNTWDGLILDMTDYPVNEVKALVLGAVAPPGTKPIPKKTAEN